MKKRNSALLIIVSVILGTIVMFIGSILLLYSKPYYDMRTVGLKKTALEIGHEFEENYDEQGKLPKVNDITTKEQREMFAYLSIVNRGQKGELNRCGGDTAVGDYCPTLILSLIESAKDRSKSIIQLSMRVDKYICVSTDLAEFSCYIDK